MSDRQDPARLAKAAKELMTELEKQHLDSSFRIKRKPQKPDRTDSGGWCVAVATWKDQPRIELWLDKFLARRDRHFWFGFSSEKQNQVESLVSRAPGKLQPKKRYSSQDITTIGGVSMFKRKSGPSEHDISHPILEDYGVSFFGMYDVGSHGSSDRLQLDGLRAANFIGDVVNAVHGTTEVDGKELTGTKKKMLRDARLGQGWFRRSLVRKWKGCGVTGCRIFQLVRASHIKPWNVSDDRERLDPNNGILLLASLDAAFENGFISFADSGQILISRQLPVEARHLLGIRESMHLRHAPSEASRGYLRYHRKRWNFQS